MSVRSLAALCTLSFILLCSVAVAAPADTTEKDNAGIKPDWFSIQWQVQRNDSQATLWMCDWSENGSWVGCVYFDSHVNIYNSTTGGLVKSLDLPKSTTRCDGLLPRGYKYPTRYLDFSPDGRYLAVACDDRSAYVFQTFDWTLYRQLTGHKGAVLSLQFSSDSAYLLTGSGKEKVNGTGIGENVTKVWDLSTGEAVATLSDQQNGGMIAIIYSPSGKQFAIASDDCTICIYNAKTFKLERRLEGHTSGVLDCDWSPDEKRMVSGSRDYTARVWDLVENKSVKYEHDNCVRCTRWDKQGKYFVTSGIEKTARIYDPAVSEPLVMLEDGLRKDMFSNVMASKFSPDGTHLASALGKCRTLIMYEQKEPAKVIVIFTKERVGIGIFLLVSLIALIVIVIKPVRDKMHRRRG